ncbi:MAG: BMP family ABC transporter substrate-binding protein, partial [Desulfobacterales bacterium]|nr:BMP family ABC transporter substrate-binding protein [Desulfobacterales bacterium]
MRFKLVVSLLLVVGLVITVGGVGLVGASPDGIKLALVATPPGKGDVAWNFMHWLGAERAKEQGYVEDYVEVISTEAKILADLTLLAQSGQHDLISVYGWEFLDALKVVANDFPEQNFTMSDVRPEFDEGEPGDEAVLGILFQQEQPSALAGALGALLAVHHDFPHVGIVLGKEGAVLYEFEMGYKWGVDWAIKWAEENRPELLNEGDISDTPKKERVLWTYTGTWSDPARGREATEIQIRHGAEVVYAVAGATGLGVLEYV